MATTAHAFLRRRLNTLQKTLTPPDALLLSKPTDITYFTGFPQLAPNEREAFLVVTAQQATLFHHSFSPLMVRESWLKSVPKASMSEVCALLSALGTTKVWLDEHTLTVAEFHELTGEFTGKVAGLPQDRIWQQRMVKDDEESACMHRAGSISARVWRRVRPTLKVGLTEREIANRIVALMLEEGAQEPAFPVIVAFGAHAALPHHQPTNLKLTAETPVLVDFGARAEGYCSDMTRTVWFGTRPSPEFQKIETIVKAAYDTALAALASSTTLTAQNLDAAAREFITAKGFGNQFIHTTGHGLGLEIHEPPSVGWNNPTALMPGMAITVEPGIYLPDKLGYRYENTVLLTTKKPEVLTAL